MSSMLPLRFTGSQDLKGFIRRLGELKLSFRIQLPQAHTNYSIKIREEMSAHFIRNEISLPNGFVYEFIALRKSAETFFLKETRKTSEEAITTLTTARSAKRGVMEALGYQDEPLVIVCR